MGKTKEKNNTPSYLAGRSIGRGNTQIDFATSSERLDEIQQEAATITDFSSVPIIPLELIESNPFQRKRRMSEKKLQELENDMQEHGITSVIVGRYHPDDKDPARPRRVQIAYGHRRVRCTRRLNEKGLPGFEGYPILIKDLSDWEMRVLMVGENRWREDLSPLDEADQMQAFVDAGLTQEEAAKIFQVSRRVLGERLELLGDDPDIQALVEEVPDTVRAARDLRKERDLEIRAQAIQDLRLGVITGTQVPVHLETLRQAKQRRAQEQAAAARGASGTNGASDPCAGEHTQTPQKPAVTSNTNTTPTVVASTNGTRPSTALSGTPGQPTPTKDSALVEQTRQQSNALLEQSRLKSWYKNVADYGTRLNKRLGQQETIPPEEVELVQRLHQIVEAQLEKLRG